MPTYHEVMTTDLSKLTTAATGWEDMAGEFEKLEERYKQDVHGISLGLTWQGLSADAANGRFTVTLNEYKAAQKEAKAIAALLRGAHSQFVQLRGEVRSLRDDAVKAGMTVSEQGHVSFDTTRLSDSERSAYVHDPSQQEAVRSSVSKWTAAITAAVKAVTDADDGVRIALKGVVVDSDPLDGTFDGFNAGAKSEIELYEAEHAKDIATRINGGEKVSTADLAELGRAFRDNSSRPEFTQAFLNGMGAENALKFTNRLNDLAYHDDKKHKATYLHIEKGLANSLANAMQDPKSQFYTEFREQLKEAGTEKFDLKEAGERPNVISRGHGQQVRGYQSLVTLMEQGDGYSASFLHDLADDIRTAEDKKRGGDPSVWDLQGDFGGKQGGWFANDPLDGVLGIMAKDPAAATSYLDPGPGRENDNLQYLLKERDWKLIDTPEWRGNIETHTDHETEERDVRTGLGLLIESSATGHTPLGPNQDPWPVTPHTEGQARVMHDVISGLGPDQSVHENMRDPLARALASYTEDTHQILGGMGSSQYVTSATGDGFFRDGDKVHMAVSQKDLTQFMRGLADDPGAYATLHKAESRYISLEMERIPAGADGFTQSNPLSNAGAALGAYSAIREDVINDERMSAYSVADWKSKMAYHIVGGAVTPLYFTTAGGVSIAFGDTLQRGVDTWAWTLGNDMKAEADATANAGIADHYLNANNQMNLMVDSWADGRQDIDADERAGLKGEILDGHDRGTSTTQKYLTDTTN